MTDDNPTAIVPIRRKEPGWVGHRDEEWVICPWCFHRHGDGWEWAREPTETRCDNCDNGFDVEPEYSVTYRTYVKDKAPWPA